MFSLPFYTKVIARNILKDLKRLPLYLNNLNRRTIPLFISHPFLMRKYIAKFNFSFRIIEGKLIVHIPIYDVYFHITGILNLFSMDEIFIENSYGINLAQDATVLDIGANIGDSSIYFAQLPFVKKVYCFEPFPITFQQSQFNFNLNAHLKEKIIPYNFGLSNKDKVLDNVNFDIKETGGMTSVESDAPKKGKATIKLKSVVGVFEKICSQTKSKIIVKCDCEGAEYEIFDALDKSGQLKRIDFCLIEYHKGMEPLVEIFLRNGFVLLTKFTTGMGIGYLTAIKIWGNDTTRTKW